MSGNQIVLTKQDADRLRALLVTRARQHRDPESLEDLTVEIERALVLDASEIPSDIVTMGSRVHVLDLVSGERREVTLVYPTEADVATHRVSILAPLGIALLGTRVGDEVEWSMPGGVRRFRIERVEQPPPADQPAGAEGSVAVGTH